MFELFSDIYFIVYKLYYVGQNNNLDIRLSLKNWDRGSTKLVQNCRQLFPLMNTEQFLAMCGLWSGGNEYSNPEPEGLDYGTKGWKSRRRNIQQSI
jgi:hypothetical protein